MSSRESYWYSASTGDSDNISVRKPIAVVALVIKIGTLIFIGKLLTELLGKLGNFNDFQRIVIFIW